MKYRLRHKTVDAVRWKGWPHKIDGLLKHPSYPQLAILGHPTYAEAFPGCWVVQEGDRKVIYNNEAFLAKYEKAK